jgi:hypothetical protein
MSVYTVVRGAAFLDATPVPPDGEAVIGHLCLVLLCERSELGE